MDELKVDNIEKNIEINISSNNDEENVYSIIIPETKARTMHIINDSLNNPFLAQTNDKIQLRYHLPFNLSNLYKACTIFFTFILNINQLYKRFTKIKLVDINEQEQLIFGEMLSDDLLFDILLLAKRFDLVKIESPITYKQIGANDFLKPIVDPDGNVKIIPIEEKPMDEPSFLVKFLSKKLAIIIKKNSVVALRDRFHIIQNRKTVPLTTLVELKDLKFFEELNGTNARIVKHGPTFVIVKSLVTGQEIKISYDNIVVEDTDRFTYLWLVTFSNNINPICRFLDDDDKEKLLSLQDDNPDTLFTKKVKEVYEWNKEPISVEYTWLEWWLSWIDLKQWSNWNKVIVGTNISIVTILLSVGFTPRQISKIYLAFLVGTIDIIALTLAMVSGESPVTAFCNYNNGLGNDCRPLFVRFLYDNLGRKIRNSKKKQKKRNRRSVHKALHRLLNR